MIRFSRGLMNDRMMTTRDLEVVLSECFPELEVCSSYIHPYGTNPDELGAALEYVRKFGLVQDAERMLSETEPTRAQITYPIFFPGQRRKLYFTARMQEGEGRVDGYIGENFEGAALRLEGIGIRGIAGK